MGPSENVLNDMDSIELDSSMRSVVILIARFTLYDVMGRSSKPPNNNTASSHEQ